MEDQTYTLFRAFADSWAMLAIFGFFIGVVFWAFRPGSTKTYSDVADIPFRHEFQPAGDEGSPSAATSEEAR